MKKHIPLFAILMAAVMTNVYADRQDKSENAAGDRFPRLSAETLSGREVVLPDSLNAAATLVVMAFERDAQVRIDGWLGPFTKRYADDPDVSFFEVPMLKRRWVLMSPVIDGGMRRGIPEEKHGNVATYYGDIDKYRELLDMHDTSDAYLFLVGNDGTILWRDSGAASEEKLNILYEAVASVTKEKRE